MAHAYVDRHDTAAVDHVAGLLDHLHNERGVALQAADELGIAADMVELDLAELEAAYASLKQRADGSRKAA